MSRRGRPKGPGKKMRWTKFTERDLWVQIELRLWRGTLEGKSATIEDIAHQMLADGYISIAINNPFVRDPKTNRIKPHPTKKPTRKKWTAEVDVSKHKESLRKLIQSCKPADSREYNPSRALVAQYQIVKRRYLSDPNNPKLTPKQREELIAFKADCDFYLSIYKEAHETGDPVAEIFFRRL